MKFSNSQRVFHDINFTPPCNYYNLNQKEDKKILYGSLAGPRLVDETKNTFGSQKRFDQLKINKTPGPGQYFQKKRQVIYDFKKDLSNPKKFLKNTFRIQQQTPSIPYKVIDKQSLDEEDKQFIKQLNLSQNPGRALNSVRKKEPSYSFTKSPRKILPQINQNKKKIQISKSSKITDDNERNLDKQQFEAIQEQKQNNIQEENKKPFIAANEAIRKASKKRNQIINNIGCDFVPSLELIELMSKMRTKYAPGPGFYNPNNNSFNDGVDNLVEKSNKGAIFSTVKRFNVDKMSLLGPGSYDVHNESFSKKGGLIGKQKRNTLNINQKKDVEFRFYINTDKNSQYNTNTTIQRSSSCGTFRKRNLSEGTQLLGGFGSSSKRFCLASSLSKDDDKKSQVSDYELEKKKTFKLQLKARLKKLNSEDRRSTKEDSGLLGISTMATMLD